VAADEPFLRQLYRSTREDELRIFGWTSEQQDLFVDLQYRGQSQTYSQAYPGGLHQIVMLAGEPIGRLFTNDDESALLLVDISLLAEHRNKGIGQHLMRGLLSQARSTNKPVRLRVRKLNRARTLYERLGFRVTGDNGIYYEMVWDS
jgi:ribosomal protein S18 acetylase RimI-like enzyme